MHNLNAFFKLRANELGLSNKEIAEQYSLSESYVSRVFKNQKMKKENRNTLKICKALKLNVEKVFALNQTIENKIWKYLHDVYYIEGNRVGAFNEIVKDKELVKDTPYYIDILLVEFMREVLNSKYGSKYHFLSDKINYIASSLSEEEKKLFYIFNFVSKQRQYKFNEAEKMYEEANRISVSDVNINMLLAYYGFSFSWKNTKLMKNIENYYECKKYCEKTNNVNRLLTIEIKYAMLLGNNGDIEGELNHELYLLDMLEAKNIEKNKAVLINNIAYSYSLLKQYDNAIKYYLKNFKLHKDNDTCFNIAWCYFGQKNYKKAREYADIGLSGENHASYYYLFLEWLAAMLNRKYSNKSFEILMKIIDEYKDSMPIENYRFVLMELYNYHHYHHNYEEMYKVGQELLNSNVICTTKIRED